MVKNRPEIYGLVLIGGRSARMKKDKASLCFHGKAQSQQAYELLLRFCEKVFISQRKEQTSMEQFSHIYDLKKFSGYGPLAGILSAMAKFPKAAWLVLACDLPFIDEKTLKHLLCYRDARKMATAYRSRFNALPEPLCAVYEPAAQKHLLAFLKKGLACPRKILLNLPVRLLNLKKKNTLDNINTPQEYRQAQLLLRKIKSKGR